MLRSVVSARAGAVVACLVMGLGGTAVVAWSATRQPAAPPTIAPAATPTSPSATPSGRPVGPDAHGPAAFGLCRAWANHHKHDDGVPRAQGSVAMRNLVAAAGGEDKVEAFCAAVPHPGNGPKAGQGREKQDGTAGRPGVGKPPHAGPKDRTTPAVPKEKASPGGPKDKATPGGPKDKGTPAAPKATPSAPPRSTPSVTPSSPSSGAPSSSPSESASPTVPTPSASPSPT